ncbi:MAG: HTH domain-containing protein [Muribaculaceae bacterium]|nr:HTH domain-containing protein [Muribaculaceae bacterium]
MRPNTAIPDGIDLNNNELRPTIAASLWDHADSGLFMVMPMGISHRRYTDSGINVANEGQNVPNEGENVANEDKNVANEDKNVANEDKNVANEGQNVANEGQIVTNEGQIVANDVPNEILSKLTDRQRKILALIQANNKISREEISLKVHTSIKTIERDIESMRKYFNLEFVGAKAFGHWEVKFD